MLADLHSHSHFSDGAHAPEFVLERARANGITHLALTDHDCIDGMQSLAAGRSLDNIELISGVEISVAWEKLEIHIVGLCFDPADESLNDLLGRQQRSRRERIGAIASKLSRAGIEGLDDHLQTLPCVSPTRTHVCEFLVRQGIRRTRRQAFKLLARSGQFHVSASWCGMAEAIRDITGAGGLAVLAHPHRYGLSTGRLRKLLRHFRDQGGHGMEVGCSNLDNAALDRLARLASEHGLLASAGSDFHTTAATWMDLGRLPELPDTAKKNAIWLHPGWHSMTD